MGRHTVHTVPKAVQFTMKMFFVNMMLIAAVILGLGLWIGLAKNAQNSHIKQLRLNAALTRGQLAMIEMQTAATNVTIIETGFCTLEHGSMTHLIPYNFSSYQIGGVTHFYVTFLPAGPFVSDATTPLAATSTCPMGTANLYYSEFNINSCTTDPTGATLQFAQVNVAYGETYRYIAGTEVSKIIVNDNPSNALYISGEIFNPESARCDHDYFYGIEYSLPTLGTNGLGLVANLYANVPYTSMEIVAPMQILILPRL